VAVAENAAAQGKKAEEARQQAVERARTAAKVVVGVALASVVFAVVDSFRRRS
jgi:hypothetical protein